LYRWSGPDEDERQAAVRYWKRAIEITVELGCEVMNSEFNGRPEQAGRSEAQFWRSMEELLPVFEREGVQLRLEPHPDDFVEGGRAAVDLVRGINSNLVSFLYCAPHTFHMGGDITGVMEYAGDLLTHLHVADSFDHRASSGLRYIVNPPGSAARIHQHLVRPAVHRQPARLRCAHPPAPRHRSGRGRLGRVFRYAAPPRVRRHPDRLRFRLGGPSTRVHHLHAGADRPVHQGLASS
jgi:hypothetical protein